MNHPVLQVAGWCVARLGQVVVGPLNAEFVSGQITVVMGPSGVGKTTLLLSALGYLEEGLTVTGRRFSGGVELPLGAVPKGKAVYIPQHLPFNPNWEVGSFLCRLPWGHRTWWHDFWPETPDRLKQVLSVLRQLGIAHRLRATVAELSGGEIQRAALAQLLLVQPQLFVADEMATGLDPGTMQWVLMQCRSIVSASGAAAVLAMHDVTSALTIADQIILLWPAASNESPWLVHKGTDYWRSDALNALLCIARWAHEFSGVKAVHSLIQALRSKPSTADHETDVVQIFLDAGPNSAKPFASCSQSLQASVPAEGFALLRFSENDKHFIGLSCPGSGSSSRRVFLAQVPTRPQ